MRKIGVFGAIGFLLIATLAVAATIVPDTHWMSSAVVNNELAVAEFMEWTTGASDQDYPADGFGWDSNILTLDSTSPFCNLPSCNYYAGSGYINFGFDPSGISAETTYETYIELSPAGTGTTVDHLRIP